LKHNRIMITALALMIAIAGYLNFAGDQIGMDMAGGKNVSGNNTYAEGLFSEGDDMTALLDLSDEDIMSDIGSLDAEAELTGNYLEETLVVNDTLSDVSIDTASAALENEDEAVVQTGADAENAGMELPEENVPGEAVFTSSQAVASLSSVRLLKEQTRAKNKETLLEIINSTSLSESQKQDAVNDMIALTEVAEKETAAEMLLETKGFPGAVVSITDGMVDVVVGLENLTDSQLAQIEDIVVRKTGMEAENIIISPLAGK